MFVICKHCNAKHSSFEYIQDKQFSNCCHKGKVSLTENPPYPYKLENLSTGLSMDSINFRKIFGHIMLRVNCWWFWVFRAVSIMKRWKWNTKNIYNEAFIQILIAWERGCTRRGWFLLVDSWRVSWCRSWCSSWYSLWYSLVYPNFLYLYPSVSVLSRDEMSIWIDPDWEIQYLPQRFAISQGAGKVGASWSADSLSRASCWCATTYLARMSFYPL